MRCHPDLSKQPRHRVGGYAAWFLPDGKEPYDALWISIADAENPADHRVLPTGEPSVAVRRRFDSNGAISDSQIVVCATYDTGFWYRPQPREELIAVRLKPESSAAALGVDPRDHLNITPQAAPKALSSRMGATRRIAASGSPADIVQALASDLSSLATASAQNRIEEEAARLIRIQNGDVSLRNLAAHLSISDRVLRRRFRVLIGCSPKTYARRARLTNAVRLADETPSPSWARIALEAGYHDQSHMIADFTGMIGLTPQQAHVERRAQSVFCNTARQPAL